MINSSFITPTIYTTKIKASMVILLVLANCFLFLITFLFFCQLCVRLNIGSVVNTGSEGTICIRMIRSLGHQTTVHWVLQTGTPTNQTTITNKTVCLFVGTSIGLAISALLIGHTSVKPLQCKQYCVELRRQLSCFLSKFESTNVLNVILQWK